VLPVSAMSGPAEHLVWRDFPEPLRRRV